jgi:hypothetical protein
VNTFTDNITSIHGKVGEKWLGDLDSIIAEMRKRSILGTFSGSQIMRFS